VIDIAVKAFKDSHPGVEVKLVPITGDPAQQIAEMAAANDMPDVIWSIDSITPSLIDADLLLDMREMVNIDRAFKLDDIHPNALSAGSAPNNPGLFMIPAVLESVQMFYNSDMFKDSGAPLPAVDWTWDDLIAACKQIQDTHTDVKCLGYSSGPLSDAGWWAYVVPWLRGYGGDMLSADGKLSTLSTPQSIAGLQAYTELWTKHSIVVPFGRRGDCFVNQRCAVMFFVSGGIRGYQEEIGNLFDWDVQVIPAHPKGRFTGTGTYGFGIARSTTHRELAWEFVKLLVTPEVQQQIVSSRAGMPVLKSLTNDAALQGGEAPPANMQAFVQGAEFGLLPPAYPTRCGNFYSGLVQTALSEVVRDIIQTGSKVEDAAEKADAKIQACLDSAK
jgi:multiple sugar transport system substrate-binding protein